MVEGCADGVYQRDVSIGPHAVKQKLLLSFSLGINSHTRSSLGRSVIARHKRHNVTFASGVRQSVASVCLSVCLSVRTLKEQQALHMQRDRVTRHKYEKSHFRRVAIGNDLQDRHSRSSQLLLLDRPYISITYC